MDIYNGSTKNVVWTAAHRPANQLIADLRKVLASDSALTEGDRVNLNEKLCNLVRNYLPRLERCLEERSTRYHDGDTEYRKEILHKLIVLKSVLNTRDKGNVSLFTPIDEVLEQWPQLATETRRSLYHITKSAVLKELSPAERLEYVLRTMPLFSKLKRLLLKVGPSGKRYYEQILDMDGCPLRGFEPDMEPILRDYAIRGDYNYSNRFAIELVAYAVDILTGYRQFENVVSHWFPKTTTEPPEQGRVELKTIFRIAFGLRCSLEHLDYLCEGTLTSVWDALDAGQDFLRFGLHFSLSFGDAINAAKHYQPKMMNEPESQQAARDKILAFFENGSVGPKPPIEDFCLLLEELGVQRAMSHIGEGQYAWFRIDTDMLPMRTETARLCLAEICDMLTRENTERILDRFAKAYESIETPAFISRLEEAASFIARNISTCALTDPEKILSYFKSSNKALITIGSNSFFENKTSLLERICDGSSIMTVKTYTGTALTSNTMNTLLRGGMPASDKVGRGCILRLAYLHTLVRWLTGELTDDALPDIFREKANCMLDDCLYHPLFVAFPLDLIMFQALTEQTVFKPYAYQMFLPRNPDIALSES